LAGPPVLKIDLRYDIILVGGGLANGLLAYCLKRTRPDLRILLLEAQDVLGGNHTWSFHRSDVEDAPWLAPLITTAWERYEVRFPAVKRQLEGGYASIQSSTFHRELARELAQSVLLGHAITHLARNSVTLRDGVELQARCVIDGRGNRDLTSPEMGFQKFLGWELETKEPHGLEAPILMDACVPQLDGFRFLYVLPFSDRRLLVEDTRYSNSPALHEPALRSEIAKYCEQQGWQIGKYEREEKGVLPIPYFPPGGIAANGIPAIGMAGGFFHPVTGYSLPLAVKIANGLSRLPVLDNHSVAAWLAAFRARYKSQFQFLCFLNRMLFEAADPAERYQVLQHFYRLPEQTIERFYGARLRSTDYLRILSGRPPVPVHKALRCIRTRKPNRVTLHLPTMTPTDE
jgi:lycopene beta-cyclase